MRKDDITRCTFVVAKEDGKTANCRDHLYCQICGYCHKHCLDHVGLSEVIMTNAQNKKAAVV